MKKTSKELDSRDANFKNAKQSIKLDLPVQVLAFLKEARVNLANRQNVKILYPTQNVHIVMSKDLHRKNPLIVKVANLQDETLFWYLNKSVIYEGKDTSRMLDLKAGTYELFIISQSGQSDEVRFRVE